MILNRLYELAQATGRLSDPSVDRTSVAFAIKVGRSGEYRGIADYRERIELPGRGKNAKPKVVLRGGPELPVPVRAVMWDSKAKRWKTNDAAVSKGKELPAVFLADTLPRLLPMDALLRGKDEKGTQDLIRKASMKRDTFWRFIEYAAAQSNDPALQACAKLAPLMREPTAKFREQIETELRQQKLDKDNGLCTLAWTADEGTILDRETVMNWWRRFYEADRRLQQQDREQGWCQVTGQVAPLPEKIEFPIKGLKRINCRPKAYLVVGLDSASSYGLTLASSCRVSAAGIEGFTRAIQMLNENRLPSRADPTRAGGLQTSFEVGRKTLFLFWTRDRESTGLELLNPSAETLASPDQFDKLIRSVQEKAAAASGIPAEQQDQFRILALSGNSDKNSARVFVRDYLEGPLPQLQRSIAKWFTDLAIADTSEQYQGQPNNRFSLLRLAAATVPRKTGNKPDWTKLSPNLLTQLMYSAMTGRPIPEAVLVSCLGRIRAEGGKGFWTPRMALIKLFLNRTYHQEGDGMKDTLSDDEKHPAYVYGQLLRVFEEIQRAALGKVNATVVDKFYGTFAAAPAFIFSRLDQNAKHHMSRLRKEKPKKAHRLDEKLTRLMRLLPAEPPKAVLSLADQGRFALGYYHQKAKMAEEIAAYKRSKAGKTEITQPTEG